MLQRTGAEVEYDYGVVLTLGLLPLVVASRVPEQKIVAFAQLVEMVEVKVVLLRKYCRWVREPAGQAEVVV